MKFGTHLWYLSPSLVGLAFFDDKVSSETKRRMIKALDRPFEDGDRRRAEVSTLVGKTWPRRFCE